MDHSELPSSHIRETATFSKDKDMTDLARRAPIGTTSAQDRELQSGCLQLSGQEPTKVYVGAFTSGGAEVAGFGSAATGTFYQDGIQWTFQTDSEYSMFITFKFLTGVQSVDCDDLQYSPPHGDHQNKQDLAIPPTQDDYSFTVTFTSGGRHDPQIIVTPG